jgi:hypothetical protein
MSPDIPRFRGTLGAVHSDPRGDKDGSPRRLWVELANPRRLDRYEGTVAHIGGLPTRFVGVTGLDAAHRRRLFYELFRIGTPRSVRTAIWDIDVSTLDHVPTGNPAALGVWYAGP